MNRSRTKDRRLSSLAMRRRGVVFTTWIGTPIRRAKLHLEAWKPLLRRAGLSDTRFHDLRHPGATILLCKSVHPQFVQELLGHSSIAITLDTYSHVIPGMNGGTAGAMNDALGD